MAANMVFQPSLVLDSNFGDAEKNFPIVLRIFTAASDKSDIYRLRYKAFRDAGWIAENAASEFEDRYDRLPTTFAIGAFHDQSCIGTLRLAFGGSGYPSRTMPCQEQFAAEVLHIGEAGRLRLVEFSRMAVEPSLANRSFRTTLYASLVRAGLILCTAAAIDIALIAVHRRISPFYQAMCGFEVIAKSETYAGIAEPTHFLALRFREMDARRRRSNAFFAFSEQEVDSARQAIEDLPKPAAA